MKQVDIITNSACLVKPFVLFVFTCVWEQIYPIWSCTCHTKPNCSVMIFRCFCFLMSFVYCVLTLGDF